MSYLSQPATHDDFGVVTVGDYINVTDGIISLPQDISPTATVEFADVNATTSLTLNGNLVVATVTPSAGSGISLTDTDFAGAEIKFKINNTGVLSLIPGTGISVSGSAGNITISTTGTSVINTTLTTGSTYTASATDEYIGVKSNTAVTISLPIGTAGRTYIIKDEYGQGSGKITVTGQPGELLDNSASYIISVPFQSICVVFRGTAWHLI